MHISLIFLPVFLLCPPTLRVRTTTKTVSYKHGVIVCPTQEEKERPLVSSFRSAQNVLILSSLSFYFYFFFPLLTADLRTFWIYLWWSPVCKPASHHVLMLLFLPKNTRNIQVWAQLPRLDSFPNHYCWLTINKLPRNYFPAGNPSQAHFKSAYHGYRNTIFIVLLFHPEVMRLHTFNLFPVDQQRSFI